MVKKLQKNEFLNREVEVRPLRTFIARIRIELTKPVRMVVLSR
jgi:hypothetical protein